MTYLEFLGSAKAEFCVEFEFKPSSCPDLYENIKQHKVQFQAKQWYTHLIKTGVPSTDDSQQMYAGKLDNGWVYNDSCGKRKASY